MDDVHSINLCLPPFVVRFFETTPSDLIRDGLYKDLALALMCGRHRDVSIALLAKKLGATKFNKMSLAISSSSLGEALAKSSSALGDAPALPNLFGLAAPETSETAIAVAKFDGQLGPFGRRSKLHRMAKSLVALGRSGATPAADSHANSSLAV